MRREVLLRHLRRYGCELLRAGARHSWWHNPSQNKRPAVPRYSEIDDHLAHKVCKDLGIPRVR
jgi:mRNA interferase HicA